MYCTEYRGEHNAHSARVMGTYHSECRGQKSIMHRSVDGRQQKTSHPSFFSVLCYAIYFSCKIHLRSLCYAPNILPALCMDLLFYLLYHSFSTLLSLFCAPQPSILPYPMFPAPDVLLFLAPVSQSTIPGWEY